MKLENNIHGNINLLGDLFSAKKVFYDSSISGLPTNNVQVAIDTLDVSLDAVYADAFGVETVSRTIYVETTGSDTTGDGLTVGTAFATIGKALSTIRKVINGGVTVTIQVGIGSFDLSSSDVAYIAAFNGDGSLTIQGTFVLVESGFTWGSADVNDPLTYNVSGGNTGSWTIDQFKFCFIKKGTAYHPISSNTNTTVSITYPSITAVTEIYQLQTILNIPTAKDIMVGTVKLTLSQFQFNITYASFKFESKSKINEIALKYSYLYSSTNKSVRFYNGLVSSICTNRVAIFMENGSNYIISAYLYCPTSYALYYTSKVTINIFNIVFESGATDGALIVNGDLRYNINTLESVHKFVNCLYAITYGDNYSLIKRSNHTIVLVNTGYLFAKISTADGDYFPSTILLKLSKILGTPTIRWFYNTMYEFVNLGSSRNIQITGLIYPEFEQNLSSTLTNNTITPIIIGDVSQNISCKVDYTIKRGSGFRSGNFNIISDVSNSYITPDIFGTNFDAAVDASAIYFSTDISNGKYIMMNVTQNNSTDASLFYNVSRVMRTPIII